MVVALPFTCELPVTVSWAMVVVANWETPVKVTLPLVISVARVDVLVTVKLAMVDVANVEAPITLSDPFNVVAFVTVSVPEII